MAESYKTMKKAIKYSIILCVASWIYAAIMIFGLGIKSVSAEPMKYTICASLYMLLPLITAVVLQMINKEKLTSTGLWHFPLILLGHNYPQHSVAGVFMMVIFCVLLSFIETYFVLKAKSVYPAAIFHGAINAVAGLNVLLIKGGNDLINGASGLSGFIVMAIVIAVIYVFDRFVLKDNIFSKTIGEVLDNVER